MMNPRLKKYIPLVMVIVGVTAFAIYKLYYLDNETINRQPERIQRYDNQNNDNTIADEAIVDDNLPHENLDDIEQFESPEYEPQHEQRPNYNLHNDTIPNPAPSNETPPINRDSETPESQLEPDVSSNPPAPELPTPPAPPELPDYDDERQPRIITQPVFMVIPKN